MSVDSSAVKGDLARRNIHSAVIKNQTSDTIHCLVEYRTLSGTDNEIIEFEVNGNEEHKLEEKVHATSTNSSSSSFSNVFPKVIYSIIVKRADDSKTTLMAPFDNVPHESVRNWKFIVTNDQIQSVQN